MEEIKVSATPAIPQTYSREFFQQHGKKGQQTLRKKLGKKGYLALKKKASSSRKKKITRKSK